MALLASSFVSTLCEFVCSVKAETLRIIVSCSNMRRGCRPGAKSWSSVTTAVWGQELVVFDKGHAEEIGDLAGTKVAEFLIEALGALERRSRVECNASAILAAKFNFSLGQQLRGDSRPLAGWEDSHASEVAFVPANGLAGDGADDLA